MLEDEVLNEAKDRKLKLLTFLEKIKFDRDKFEIDNKLKNMKKADDSTDLFVVEADYKN